MENMIVINNRQYMGIDEAAKSLGVSVHHVRREMYRNNIPLLSPREKILFLQMAGRMGGTPHCEAQT